MDKCSYGIHDNQCCSDDHVPVGSLTDEVVIKFGGDRKAQAKKDEIDNCPRVDNTEAWLLIQRVPSLNNDSLICGTHRKKLSQNSATWMNLGKKCYHPDHPRQVTGRKRAKAAVLHELTVADII